MQVDHDINNKIITISQPGYVDTLLDRFQFDKIFSKCPSKISFRIMTLQMKIPYLFPNKTSHYLWKLWGHYYFYQLVHDLISPFTSIIFPFPHPMMAGISIHLNNFSGSCITISKKAKLLALSSTEAEYLALFEASKTIMCL